jgi:hypothetical protein
MFALAAAVFLPLLVYASAPSWWAERGVLVSGASTNDYAPANQGQLKNIAKAAAAEMDSKLEGGAGDQLHSLIASWSTPTSQTNDFAPVNLGQLKNVAKPFYDRLIATGLVNSYPWLSSSNPADDFAMANIGQLKSLFSFELPPLDPLYDGDNNGLPDAWEQFYFGQTGVDPNADFDGDGLTNLQEFQLRTDPHHFDALTAFTFASISGNNQSADPGLFLAAALVVELRNPNGQGIPNAEVTFSGGDGLFGLTNGTGQLHPSLVVRTDAAGRAAVYWQTPYQSNVSKNLIATVNIGNTIASAAFTAMTTDPPAPVAPSNVAALRNEDGTTTVTWQDNSDNEDGFIIERQKPDGSWEEIGWVDPNVISFDVPN